MKTVQEVIEFLESEIKNLEDGPGYYGEEIEYLQYLIKQITGS
jgi:hypothetical protein